jgi:molybdopterin synthase sulfur carrier subunit
MNITVRIPQPLRKLTNGQSELSSVGKTARELIANLDQQYAGLKERLCDEAGAMRRFVNIYVNNEDIRFLKDLDTALKDGDLVSIVPAIAGGVEENDPRNARQKVYLTFPRKLIQEPVVWRVGKKFDVITNIRGASVSEEIDLMALELEGESAEIVRTTGYLKRLGIKVEPIEKDVIE